MILFDGIVTLMPLALCGVAYLIVSLALTPKRRVRKGGTEFYGMVDGKPCRVVRKR